LQLTPLALSKPFLPPGSHAVAEDLPSCLSNDRISAAAAHNRTSRRRLQTLLGGSVVGLQPSVSEPSQLIGDCSEIMAVDLPGLN
jgi:hypothetical protein